VSGFVFKIQACTQGSRQTLVDQINAAGPGIARCVLHRTAARAVSTNRHTDHQVTALSADSVMLHAAD